jgi:hypothetical protein
MVWFSPKSFVTSTLTAFSDKAMDIVATKTAYQIPIFGQCLLAIRESAVCGRASAKCMSKMNPVAKAAYTGSAVASGCSAIVLLGGSAASLIVPNAIIVVAAVGEGLSIFGRNLEKGGDLV